MKNGAAERAEAVRAEADRIASQILTLTRNGLFVSLRFLDLALCQFEYINSEKIRGIATTGQHIVYNSQYVIESYMKDRQSLSRDYLHMVLHCVFRHPFVSENLHEEYWNLAADIAVETIIDELDLKQTSTNDCDEVREEVARIKNLKDLQNNIFTLPKESLLYHITRNNVSRWLCSRALFPISEFLKHITWRSLQDVDAHRQIIYDAIVSYRRMKNQGVVAVFHRDRFDRFSNFARIGEGSLGGKGRGLAFLDHIIKQHPELNAFDNADVMIPKTVVLCTDIFDEFMDTNELYQIALSDIPDEEILRAFLQARLPERLIGDLEAYLDVVRQPIAIRSSSLLEDAHYQPFAGIYST